MGIIVYFKELVFGDYMVIVIMIDERTVFWS